MKNSLRVSIKVQLYDIDSMNVVWHGNYVRFLEVARNEFLSKIGFGYNDMKDAGYIYPVAKLDLKYIKPAMFDENLEVLVELVNIESFLKLNYTIFNAKGEKICKASTSQACVKISNLQTQFNAPEILKSIVKDEL